MPDFIRRRLIYFTTGSATQGGRISDFVTARSRRCRNMMLVMKVCFLIEIISAAAAVISGFFCSVALIILTITDSLAFLTMAFLSFSGNKIYRISAYIVSLLSAVICFVCGAFTCGTLTLAGTLAAFVIMIIGWMHDYLESYSPLNITKNDYFYTGALSGAVSQTEQPKQPPVQKTELEKVAEQFSMIMKGESH